MDEQRFKEPLAEASLTKRGELVDWLCLAGLYSIFMVGNVWLPTVLVQMKRASWTETAGFFLVGTLAAEIGTLGVWMALGKARWLHRLLGCGLLLGLSATCYIIGLMLLVTYVLHMEVALFIYSLFLGGWCITWFALALVRAYFGQQISLGRGQPDATANRRVSIRFIFVATTAVAALIAMVKVAMPPISGGGVGPLPKLAFAFSVYAVHSLLLLIPCCWIGLKKPTPYWWIPALMLEIYLLGRLTIRCVTWGLGLASYGQAQTTFFFAYSLGFVVSTLLAFAVLRYLGFELRTPSQSVVQ